MLSEERRREIEDAAEEQSYELPAPLDISVDSQGGRMTQSKPGGDDWAIALLIILVGGGNVIGGLALRGSDAEAEPLWWAMLGAGLFIGLLGLLVAAVLTLASMPEEDA
jgi:hypothetical protein